MCCSGVHIGEFGDVATKHDMHTFSYVGAVKQRHFQDRTEMLIKHVVRLN